MTIIGRVRGDLVARWLETGEILASWSWTYDNQELHRKTSTHRFPDAVRIVMQIEEADGRRTDVTSAPMADIDDGLG